MHFDVQGHLSAVDRYVSALERDRQPARAVALSRSFVTTAENLWDALTTRERLPRWFLPISGELELGGRYQFKGNAGGVITACERPSHFALTWEFGGGLSWVGVHIGEDEAGHPRLTLTHVALLSEHWDEYGPGATGVGWDMGLLGLAMHLARPTAPKPDEAAFAASSDGKAFIAGSSGAWGQAAVAAGMDAAAARAAAARTTAFYTGSAA